LSYGEIPCAETGDISLSIALSRFGFAILHPTSRVHESRQTDFTYFRIVGWGWYFLSTILDDYSRYIISWRLTTTMAAADVTDTLEDTLAATGLLEARVRHKPRLLSNDQRGRPRGQQWDIPWNKKRLY
jgi:transposase InsO family protein